MKTGEGRRFASWRCRLQQGTGAHRRLLCIRHGGSSANTRFRLTGTDSVQTGLVCGLRHRSRPGRLPPCLSSAEHVLQLLLARRPLPGGVVRYGREWTVHTMRVSWQHGIRLSGPVLAYGFEPGNDCAKGACDAAHAGASPGQQSGIGHRPGCREGARAQLWGIRSHTRQHHGMYG